MHSQLSLVLSTELKITAGPRPFSVQFSTMATQNLIMIVSNCTDGRSKFHFGQPNLKSYLQPCSGAASFFFPACKNKLAVEIGYKALYFQLFFILIYYMEKLGSGAWERGYTSYEGY